VAIATTVDHADGWLYLIWEILCPFSGAGNMKISIGADTSIPQRRTINSVHAASRPKLGYSAVQCSAVIGIIIITSVFHFMQK
jgi:uncharacterized transporter YbjL